MAPAASVFRSGTRLVQVDVVAQAKNGPAIGLTEDDFTLLDNGKPQRIAVFSVKSQRSLSQSAAPLPPGAVSNRVNRKRRPAATSTTLLIDRLNTRGSQDKIGIDPLDAAGSQRVPIGRN